jgi:N-acetylglucosaminyl-diphospho-decaprenol L-rhamnosyltransferase
VSSTAPPVVDVSVIIVSYRTRALTVACIESLITATRHVTYDIILIDNHSQDGTVEAVRQRFPQVQCVPLTANVGFGAAVNLAARSARGEYLLLLNPDTIVQASAVDLLVSFARTHPSHGIYGGQTRDTQGAVDPRSVWGAPTRWSQLCWTLALNAVRPRSRIFDPESLGPWQRDTVREVPAVIGSLLLVSVAVWRELDGFDERYFMYSEDIDLSLRARAAGWRPVLVPDARITHYFGGSSARRPDRTALVLKGRVTLMRKHWDAPSFQVGRLLLLIGVALRGSVEVLRRSRGGGHQGGHWTVVLANAPKWLSGWR